MEIPLFKVCSKIMETFEDEICVFPGPFCFSIASTGWKFLPTNFPRKVRTGKRRGSWKSYGWGGKSKTTRKLPWTNESGTLSKLGQRGFFPPLPPPGCRTKCLIFLRAFFENPLSRQTGTHSPGVWSGRVNYNRGAKVYVHTCTHACART